MTILKPAGEITACGVSCSHSAHLTQPCWDFLMYLTVRKSLSKFHFEKEPTDGQSQVTDRLIKLLNDENDENAALKNELDMMKTDLEDAKDTARKQKLGLLNTKKFSSGEKAFLKRMMKSKH